jgi:3D (Asp-Asp-Asp) domain-containing protein
LKVLAVIGLLAYPVIIQADTAIPHHPQSTVLAAPVAAAATSAPVAAASVAVAATPVVAPAASTVALAGTSTAPTIASDTKTVWVTAYTSDPDETSDHPLITASGGMVRDGVVAANFLPFGTKIQIPSLFGNKVFVVEDRTSQKFSGRVDIWMSNVSKAINFGIRHAQIVVLDQNLAAQ